MYVWDPIGTLTITAQVGTNTDIFDIAINQDADMLYLLEAGPLGNGFPDALQPSANTTPDALANSARLSRKITANLDNYLYYDYDRQEGAATLLITYGITTQAAIDAVSAARGNGKAVSLLVMKTLNPVAPKYYEICRQYDRIVIAEENLEGDLRRILFGQDKDTAAK